MTGYEQIKQLKKQLHCKIGNLLAEADINNPFYAGSKANTRMANWFAELWRQFGYGTGIHLRRDIGSWMRGPRISFPLKAL